MPTRLAQHLIARGLLPGDRVEEALRRQAIAGGALDTVLLEQGLISEAGMLQALADVSGVRLVSLGDFEPNHEVAALIPPKIAERLCVVPLSVDGDALHVACSYPVPTQQLQEVGFLLGKRLELWIALECRIRDWLSAIYGIPLPARFASLLAALDPRYEGRAARGDLALGSVTQDRPAHDTAGPVPQGSVPIETVTLEDALTAEMVERLAQSVAEEPIPLEVKKVRHEGPAPSGQGASGSVRRDHSGVSTAGPDPVAAGRTGSGPTANVYDRVETVVLDVSGYAAFAREALKPATHAPDGGAMRAPPSGPVPPQNETWTVPPTNAAIAPPPARSAVSANRSSDLQDVPTQKALRAVERPAQTAAAPTPPDSVPDWTLEKARAALREATKDRDLLIDVALRYARRTFDFVAAFAVVRGSAVGWDVRGEGADRARLAALAIPLDAASVFRTVALTRGSYVGPLPPDALTSHFLGLIGRQPRTVFLFPVEVKSRLVAILYGDSGHKPLSQRRLSDFILFCQELPAAFQELIVHRKQRLLGGVEYAVPSTSMPEPVPVSTLASDAAPTQRVGWSPSAAVERRSQGRVASMPPLPTDEADRPPPDFGPILKRLTGPDAAMRARAMAELARTPEAAARVLTERFPGPTAWSRLPVVELPEADELGPIPGALVRLGRAAAVALAPLLDADDSDTRYFALLTAGNLPYPELVDGVLRGLFDLEPDISSAARVAATRLRRLPRFDAAMKDLRQELASRDPLRRSLAARALGTLHDRESIDGLIGLTGSDDQMCAQAAAEALREITKASFGTQPRLWTAWWAENRTRRRLDWLLAGLRHRDLDVRMSAIDELSRAFNDHLGYHADAPAAEREAAVRKWEAALARSVRGDFDI